MKSDIEYFYNFKINELNQNNNYYSFIYNYDNYYFVPLNRPLEDLKDLLLVSQELNNKKINTHQFIFNKDQKLVTIIDEVNYIMLKLNENPQKEIDLIDIVNFQNSLILNPEKSKLYRNDWANLWASKIDYFEYQISQIGKEKEIILNSFSYYVGLAENA